jgi:ribosomal protein S18 acetylase RimI-like enzyme
MGHDEHVVVEEVEVVAADVLEAIAALLPQLSSSAPAPSAEQLAEMVGSPTTTVLVARGADRTILGSLTLAVFRVPSGVRAWIEDVVVDQGARGQGVATALVQAAVERAGGLGARTIELTSRPERDGANRLYKRLGFEARPTNVYRLELDSPGPVSA